MSQIKNLPCSLLTENMQITLLLFEMMSLASRENLNQMA